MTLDEGDSQEDEEVGEGERDADRGDGDGETEPVDDKDACQREFLVGVSLDPTGKRPAPCFLLPRIGSVRSLTASTVTMRTKLDSIKRC